MNISDLTPEDQEKALRHFRRAILLRAEQWDNERQIEMLLGREVELDISGWASCMGPNPESICPDSMQDPNLEDLIRATDE